MALDAEITAAVRAIVKQELHELLKGPPVLLGEALEVQFLEAPGMREIAREEIASLCGLFLRRLGPMSASTVVPGQSLEGAMAGALSIIESTWAEALADFSGHTGGGDEPGGESDA